MNLLRSLLFALIFYPGTVLVCTVALLVTPLGRGPLRAVVRFWAVFHRWLVKHVLRIRFVWNREVPEGAYLIAVKHHAMLEAVDTLRFARTPIVVMKQELVDLPLWGWVTRVFGVIGVDRKAGAKALRDMVKRGRKAQADGRPIVIFPEGTRVPAGAAPKLGAGFAGLYRMLGMPVIPIAHDSIHVWPKGFVKQAGTVRFHVGDVIPPGLSREEIERAVHEAINRFVHEDPSAPADDAAR
ncbi:lysophospholipid acyltransferase family protein [Sphingomicrobium astaxanthinifaciens]|uniref:lysophospholipid acyltransferase family protein n=1 Tax=Sphingomicrobium astaxanthinifaciens TaxID=1227949 RepID=UPI001FCC5AF0|nr:lysophospholipid acyltransferase family protein [Sphingomicrobium astaxanthinifaciens]MCJ7421153.1 1-acyl-sn-glycerol-3-phosphate acyltransferase [Sphingomicrobium astaxanthinifaciens]